MTHIAVLGSTNMDLVAYVAKAPQRGETVTGREFRTIPGGRGANQAVAAVDLLVPNEHEAAALTGVTDPREAATALLDQVPEVVVTLGAAGSLYAARGAEPFTVPAPRVTAVDSTGAGDTSMPYRSEIDVQATTNTRHAS
ncbi:PfkB family carbohydrate kinase [Streptomyces mirabilis]|uniref:PfkB family carbohydrate kinase n=1 Tax=Streptomyces mirabilis TaxID=68239 RepID=UPI00369BC709